MNKIVITGGAGFIGSHLSEALADRGYQVIIIDNLSTGSMEYIGSFINKGNVAVVKGNILDLPLIKKSSS